MKSQLIKRTVVDLDCKKTYEYHKLNNLQNIKMPNKSNVNKTGNVIILQQ